MTFQIEQLVREVAEELTRATSLYGPMRGPHEALGVIEEEFIEFRDEVFAFNLNKDRDTRPEMRKELIQLAAMALKAVINVTDGGNV